MEVHLATFASEFTKIAEDQAQEHRPGLVRAAVGATAAAIPYQAAMSVAGVPKGMIDKAVEQTVRGTKNKTLLGVVGKTFQQGLGRGAATFPSGLITAPLFISGMNDLRSRDPDRQGKGYAKVVSSGMAFSALKGGGEAFINSIGRKNVAGALKNIKGTALARALSGTAAAALTAGSVARATRTDKPKNTRGGLNKYVVPTLVGASVGAAKGALDEAVVMGRKATVRGIAAKASGRAAAGALGALVLAQAVKRLLPSKKNPQVKRWQRADKYNKPRPLQKMAEQKAPNLGPTSSGIYDQTKGWAKKQNDVDVYEFYKQVNAQGQGERSPSRRAAFYALHDELAARGHKLPALKLRGEAAPKLVKAPGLVDTAALLSIAAAPGLGFAAVKLLPPTDRDRVLDDALDRMIIQKNLIRRETNPRAPLFDIPFVSKALGWEESRMGGPHFYEGSDVDGKRVRELVLRPKGKELPGIIAHELGHASAGSTRKLLMTAPAHWAHAFGSVASIVLPLMAMDATGDGSFTTDRDLDSRAKLIAGFGTVAAALQAPVIAEETMANVKALKYLRRAGASVPEAAMKALMHAGPGYATYVVPAAVPFLAAAHLKLKAMRARRRAE